MVFGAGIGSWRMGYGISYVVILVDVDHVRVRHNNYSE